MFLSDNAIECAKRIKDFCDANKTKEFDPSAYPRKELLELQRRGLVELTDVGIIEVGVFHPEVLS